MISRETAESIARTLLQPMLDAGMCDETHVMLGACIVEAEVAMEEQQRQIARQFKACTVMGAMQ